MFKLLSGVAAALAVLAVSMADAPPAEAQAKRCKKVGISFACRNRGSGKTVMPCRGGETEAQCCARWKKRANDPRRGWCTGRSGGVASFKCACAKKKGGKRPEPRAGLRRASPDSSDSAVAPNRNGQLVISNIGSSGVDGVDSSKPGRLGAKKTCRKVKYVFVCRDGNKGSGAAACRRGEPEAQCCARIKRTVAQACKRHGGLAKFKCACTKKMGGKDPQPRAGIRRVSPDTIDPASAAEPRSGSARARAGTVLEEIEVEKEVDRTSVPLVQASPSPDGTKGAPGGLVAKKCPKVKYAFVCRGGNNGSGAAGCQPGETEAKCCARIKKKVKQACKRHGGLNKFKCKCAA